MTTYTRSVVIAAPIDAVFHFHDDTGNLLRITPPGVKLEILEIKGDKPLGRRIRLRMTQFGVLRNELVIEFMKYEPPHLLIDQQMEGPFKFWRQTRKFEETEGGTRLTDTVEYEVPFGIIGRIADTLLIGSRVRSMFEYRQRRTREILEGPFGSQKSKGKSQK